MPLGDKYRALTDYLINRGEDKIEMTKAEIEGIIPVPNSAKTYAWSNYEGTPFNRGWLNAGYRVSVSGDNVTFYKNGFDDNKIYVDKLLQQTGKRNTTLDIDIAIKSIRKYHTITTEGQNTRYRSWEHCFRVFRENRNAWDKADFLCLHLAFYLASWGMYRGSSFLLNMDYKAHMPIIEIILSGRYDDLFTDEHSPSMIPSVIHISKEIVSAYENTYGKTPTDTLVTKILLGVFGCAPAYDEYFRTTAKRYRICGSLWSKKSLADIWHYYEMHRQPLENIREEISATNKVLYTPMKLMDMCLWQIGYDRATSTLSNPAEY